MPRLQHRRWIGAVVAFVLLVAAALWIGSFTLKDSGHPPPTAGESGAVVDEAPRAPVTTAPAQPERGPTTNGEPIVTRPPPKGNGGSGTSAAPGHPVGGTGRAPASATDVDALLARMEFGNIAFNVPQELNVKETALIQLLLSATTALDELQRELTAPGTGVGAHVKISERMEARLTGPEFDITTITPETQAVSRQVNTEWKWEIKPRRVGTHALHLTLSALVTVDGETTPRTIKTFDRDIVIEITPAQRAAAFIAANWQWLWAAILVPLATWWWKRRASRAPQ
jgi:hypothetical protein